MLVVGVSNGDGATVSRRTPAQLIQLALLPTAALSVAALLGTVRGWSCLIGIGRGDRPRSQALPAAAAALFWPVVTAWAISFAVCLLATYAYYGGPEVPNAGRAVHLLGTIVLAATFTSGLVVLTVRTARGRRRLRDRSGVNANVALV